MASTAVRSFRSVSLVVGAIAVALAVASAAPADAATVINGPVDLGTAADYGVLAATAITNTGATTVDGDVGLSPGEASSITGTGSITPTGSVHAADNAALIAQHDLGTAYTTAAGLTPIPGEQDQLGGLNLTPGVYNSASTLDLTGVLTLNAGGDPNAVWVFQAGSALTTAVGSSVSLINGASACNVFWQIGSSATLAVGSSFVGNVMAHVSISAGTGTLVTGRLLAETGAITLDTNTITRPTGCAAPGAVSASPGLPAQTVPPATVGVPFSYTPTSSGSPAPTFAVTSGALPAGLSLDTATGRISGTPTTPGTSTFSITASNGTAPEVTTAFTITVQPVLAATGADAVPPAIAGGALLLAGMLALTIRRRLRHR